MTGDADDGQAGRLPESRQDAGATTLLSQLLEVPEAAGCGED